jgi:F-type H+-transporting ATPase subunit delta
MAEAELSTVARPYARAAFSQGLDEASGLQTWARMLSLLAATISNSRVREALDNPRLTTLQQAELVVDVMGEELNEHGQNFVHVLAEHGRTMLLPQIQVMFELLKANHEKTMDVEITSAFEVEESDLKVLTEALKKRLQREVKLTTSVDQTLLGGVLIRAEDTVIDNSVRGKLKKLSTALH